MTILEIWWKNNTKCFSIRNHRKSWKKYGNKPRLLLHHNGAKRKKGDKCFDISLIVGYTIFNYTNFDLQKEARNAKP